VSYLLDTNVISELRLDIPVELPVRRIMDIWLAAIGLHHGLTLVTRNERDFQDLGVKVVNPWKGYLPQ
jgi:predicted nucleic acid-binding protein